MGPEVGRLEAADAISKAMSLELRSTGEGGGMPGSMSDSDRGFLTSMTAGIETTPQGRKLMIDYAIRVNKRNIVYQKMAAKYAMEHNGMLDSGFAEEMLDWAEKNPLFTKEDREKLSGLPQSGVAAFDDPEKEAAYQEWKKKHGGG